MNQAIIAMNNSIELKKTTIDDNILAIDILVVNYNNALDTDATDVSFVRSTVALITANILKILDGDVVAISDIFIKRGKDYLMMADQANQFICAANIGFARAVDVFLYINNNRFEVTITDKMQLLIDKQNEINNYLADRVVGGFVTIADAVATQTQLDNYSDEIETIISNINVEFDNMYNICSKTIDALKIFGNVLTVNTTVGIALSVTKQAWDEMKIMNQLEYTSIDTVLPPEDIADTVPNILDSNIINQKTVSTDAIERMITRVMLQSGTYSTVVDGNIIDYVVNNTKKLFTSKTFNNLNTKSLAEIASFPRFDHSQLVSTFGDIGFVSQLDTTEATLTTYYNTLVSPSITLNEFLAEAVSSEFLRLSSRYTQGINSTIINEAIKFHDDNIQFKLLNDTLNYIPENTQLTFDEMIEEQQLFDNSLNISNKFSIYFTSYIKDARTTYDRSGISNTILNDLKNDYNLMSATRGFKHFQRMGEIQITKYINGNIDRIFTKFEYYVNYYSDELNIYYAECSYNDVNFVISNGSLNMHYSYVNESREDLESVLLEDMVISTTHSIEHYLFSSNYNPFSFILTSYHNVYKQTIKDISQTKKRNIIISTIFNGTDYEVNKSSTGTNKNVIYIDDNPIAVITTAITNVYRDELIAGRMDFSRARTNSMVSSLRHLKYRDELEAFIDLTWDAGIPHPERG